MPWVSFQILENKRLSVFWLAQSLCTVIRIIKQESGSPVFSNAKCLWGPQRFFSQSGWKMGKLVKLEEKLPRGGSRTKWQEEVHCNTFMMVTHVWTNRSAPITQSSCLYYGVSTGLSGAAYSKTHNCKKPAQKILLYCRWDVLKQAPLCLVQLHIVQDGFFLQAWQWIWPPCSEKRSDYSHLNWFLTPAFYWELFCQWDKSTYLISWRDLPSLHIPEDYLVGKTTWAFPRDRNACNILKPQAQYSLDSTRRRYSNTVPEAGAEGRQKPKRNRKWAWSTHRLNTASNHSDRYCLNTAYLPMPEKGFEAMRHHYQGLTAAPHHHCDWRRLPHGCPPQRSQSWPGCRIDKANLLGGTAWENQENRQEEGDSSSEVQLEVQGGANASGNKLQGGKKLNLMLKLWKLYMYE